MRLPIGDYIAAFIDWFQDTFGPILSAISAVLGWAIAVLENCLQLDHTRVYPSVFLVLLAGLLVWLTVKRFGPQKLARLLAVGAVVAVAVVEVLRYRTLERELTPESATELAATLEAYGESLRSAAPDDYARALEAIDAIRTESRLSDDAERLASRYERSVERLRDERYGDAADELEELALRLEEAEESGVPEAKLEDLREVARYYALFSSIDEMERIADRLRDRNEPARLREALNERTYDRAMERLQMETTAREASAGDNLVTLQTKARSELARLDPRKLNWYPTLAIILAMVVLARLLTTPGFTLLCAIGLPLIASVGLWEETMLTLALVLAATFIALLIGVPLGIATARSELLESIVKPVLDFMQTMPAFVYLIPAVLIFGLGVVPGSIATLIFAMPPAVRLTVLGIRQVPTEVVEAAQAFGATDRQMLIKAQLPIALPTIMAGLNQTIMLALSMVVIIGMIGAGGLGEVVLSGIQQMRIGLGFESGLSVVILAIYLDRITQSLGARRS